MQAFVNSWQSMCHLAGPSLFRWKGIWWTGLLVAIVGCGRGNDLQLATLHGKVTYKGEPVRSGSLVFVPKGGGPSAKANINPDGTYVAGTYKDGDGAIPGEHRVMITVLAEQKAGALPEDSIRDPGAPASWAIPQRYGDLANSGLTANVKPDTENEVDFALTD